MKEMRKDVQGKGKRIKMWYIWGGYGHMCSMKGKSLKSDWRVKRRTRLTPCCVSISAAEAEWAYRRWAISKGSWRVQPSLWGLSQLQPSEKEGWLGQSWNQLCLAAQIIHPARKYFPDGNDRVTFANKRGNKCECWSFWAALNWRSCVEVNPLSVWPGLCAKVRAHQQQQQVPATISVPI